MPAEDEEAIGPLLLEDAEREAEDLVVGEEEDVVMEEDGVMEADVDVDEEVADATMADADAEETIPVVEVTKDRATQLPHL
jgi:hypothetical protein